MSPNDEQTRAEGRVVHPLFEARMARLAALRESLPTGVTMNLNDETLMAIREGIKRVERGTR